MPTTIEIKFAEKWRQYFDMCNYKYPCDCTNHEEQDENCSFLIVLSRGVWVTVEEMLLKKAEKAADVDVKIEYIALAEQISTTINEKCNLSIN